MASLYSTCYLARSKAAHYQNLHTICWEALPEAARQELSHFYSANSAKNRFLAGELLHILQLFEVGKILALPFKGPLLAAVYYGDLALREFTDLDILVRERDYPKAREILANQGYRSNLASGVITRDVNVGEFRSASTGISVELHRQFSPRRFVSSIVAEDVWNSIEPMCNLGPGSVVIFLARHVLISGRSRWETWLVFTKMVVRSRRIPSIEPATELVLPFQTGRSLGRGANLSARNLSGCGVAASRGAIKRGLCRTRGRSGQASCPRYSAAPTRAARCGSHRGSDIQPETERTF